MSSNPRKTNGFCDCLSSGDGPHNRFPSQPDFFDDGELGVELAALDHPQTRHGKYSGEQLEGRLAVRDAVVKLLAEGVGIRRIARKMREAGVQIGEHSIFALRDRRPDLVATEKKLLSQQLGRIGKLMADNMEERLINNTWSPSSVDLGILLDKRAMLDGEASMIIEHRLTIDVSPDAFARRIEQMKKAKAVDCESSADGVETQQKDGN
jgi:hypothetical protein